MTARITACQDVRIVGWPLMSAVVNKSNSRFPHVFIVLRIDEFQASAEVEHRISPVATYLDQALADAEMARLNDLNGGKGSRYVVRMSRLKG